MSNSQSPRDRSLQKHAVDSSSSLVGLEQSIAPRLKPSIAADQWKPLPPPPKMRRISYRSTSRSPFELERRSSSVYSDVVAAWTGISQPPEPTREDFYKANRNNVRASMSEPQLLLPRTYQPLLATPSPDRSPPAQRPSELLPLPIMSPKLPKEHLHTISLAKAQAMVEAPGSQHLLPEELRARRPVRSRSTEQAMLPLHLDISKPQKPGSAFKSHESTTIRLPSLAMLDAQTWHNFDPTKADLTSRQDAGGRHTPRKASKDSYYADEDERGRTRHRTPRKSGHQLKTSEQLAAEYVTMLDLPRGDYDQPLSHAPSRPLANNTAATPLHLQGARQQSPMSSISPKQIVRRELSAQPSHHTVDSRPDSPPPPMFAFRDSDEDQRRKAESRTGSIPISPPSDREKETKLAGPDLERPPLPPSPTLPSPPPPEVVAALVQAQAESRLDTKAKRKARESAYYPFVASRTRKKKAKPRPLQVKPSHNVDKTPSPTSKTSSQKSQSRRGSDVPELISRAVQKAAHVAEKIVHKSTHRPIISNPITIDSPHLYPQSPANLGQSVTAVYLGWSEESKEDFDASKPISPKHHYAANTFAPNPVVKPVYEHITTPARPLDERTVESSEAPTVRGRLSRSGSIFGSLLELRKEKGRERRREEIKKTIRVLPNDSGTTTDSVRPALVEKSASDADVPSNTPELAKEPRMGLWGRRISEFGMI